MPPVTKESFARAVEALVRKYEADRDTYLSSQYNEAQTRSQFITPLLEALGWDVRNEAGVPYNLCEVLEEKGETHGRPDYTFRINGQTKFFLEAKSPSDELSSASILQTKRYAWNSRDIFFAGVCDFEQFRFFDASLRPDDKRPLDGEAFHLIYSEYASNIDKLWELSRDRVAAGSLDQFLRKDRKSLLQKVAVDKDFLDNLTNWRHELANAIHAQNPEYDAHALNEIVQRLLDRIIFIRIAEDRKVIDQRQLWDLAVIWEESGGRRNIMEQLVQVFQEFNARFNGEIFKPHPCEEIKIESHALVKIIKQLYPPKSNYRFDVIGVELLGSIYERYLGNTLRITPKRVFIEPKPEVRKAGGVYYTPQYIVDYIVKNTVGKLVEGKTPKEADKIRILDPACGSGSFLIGAFQFLIDWYLNYYREHPKEAAAHGLMPQTRTDPDGNLRLSFYAKSLIIQHNLYGVDIDPQAVEVTMMSLYLKMLEGELGIQIPKQDKLPELKYNIRCGNSLIGPDIEPNGKDGKPLSPEEHQRINPFDWNSRDKGFGDILKSGGFDAVIGNPPYIFVVGMEQNQKEYFARHYATWAYRFDVYGAFTEKGIGVLRDSGNLGFIVPHTLLTNDSFKVLRKLLLEATSIHKIVDIGPGVFESARNETMILILSKTKPNSDDQFPFSKTSARNFNPDAVTSQIKQIELLQVSGQPLVPPGDHGIQQLITKLEGTETKFGYFFHINQGLRTGDNKKLLSTKRTHRLHRQAVGGKHVKRYWCHASLYVLYDPKQLDAPRDEANYTSPEKLIVQEIRNITLPRRIVATYDDQQLYCLQSTNTVNWKPDVARPFSMKYALGILNSAILNWYFRSKFRGNNHIASNQLASLALCVPSRQDGRGVHARIVAHVDRILTLNKKKYSDKLAPAELQRLERQIAAADAEIDNLVYDLYGITPEERKIIEAQP